MKSGLVEQLRAWFSVHKRAFPWRVEPSPYCVWVSEVMLQQTQASRVVEYYARWMARFPSIAALAAAPYDEVLKVAEGLGYYARIRALHEGAKYVCEHFGGELPGDAATLRMIKGLGDYTIGAILSFGFHRRAVCIDANVRRVASRLYQIGEGSARVHAQALHNAVEALLPEREPWVIAEALIELGATICRQTPDCQRCPLRETCASFQQGTQLQFPPKARAVAYEALFREVAVIASGDHLLVRQGASGPCAELFEFPYVDCPKGGLSPDEAVHISRRLVSREATFSTELDIARHSFTRFRLTLYPKLFVVPHPYPVGGHEWHSRESIQRLTFGAGHRRILQSVWTHLRWLPAA